VLRPGNAGANIASDHIEVVDLALEQLPRDVVEQAQIVVRTDSAAATHELIDELRAARINFPMGYDLTEPVRQAVLGLSESAWAPAIRQDGEEREGAWVAEITDRLDLGSWPEGTDRAARPPAPGAQLSFSDHDGHRFLATLTDLEDDAVELERLHRAPRQHRGPRPRRQADRPGQPALPRLRPQRRLARALAKRALAPLAMANRDPGPGLLQINWQISHGR
jgi:hypothetical protein